MWQAFWAWYERNYTLNISIAFGLFILQVWHLTWLGGEVVVGRLTGAPLFSLEDLALLVTIVVDYTEIPAIFSVTLVYIDAFRRGERWYSALMLVLLHSQWLHIFWITDEFVVDSFSGRGGHAHSTVLPHWLAWIAIGVDYLEVPVMIDTGWKFWRALRERNKEVLKDLH